MNGKLDMVAKVDEAQGLVYGWASVVVTKAGELVEDRQGDVIDPADLDSAMIEFMLDHRAANEMHEGAPIGTVVESVVVSPAKLEAMGLRRNSPQRHQWGRGSGSRWTPDLTRLPR